MEQLRKRLQIEVAASGMGSEGGTLAEMLGRLGQCASGGAVPPDQLPWQLQGGDLHKGAYRIVPGIASLEDPRVLAARHAYAQLWTKISTEPAVADLCGLQAAELLATGCATCSRICACAGISATRSVRGAGIVGGTSAHPSRGHVSRDDPSRASPSISRQPPTALRVLPRPVVRYSTRDGRGWGRERFKPLIAESTRTSATRSVTVARRWSCVNPAHALPKGWGSVASEPLPRAAS